MHELRREILALAGEYAILQTAPPVFVAGQTPLNFAGRVYDDREMVTLWGPQLGLLAHQRTFLPTARARLASYVGVADCLLVNSGFSANLLAFSTLCSHRLGDRRIRTGGRGDHSGGRLPHHRRSRSSSTVRYRSWSTSTRSPTTSTSPSWRAP